MSAVERPLTGLEPGWRLANGAILLDYTEKRPGVFIVLALHAGAGAVEPFCTWEANDQGVTYWGHYSRTLDEALDDYRERTL